MATNSRNNWFIFALVCVPILIGAIDLTSIVVVLPQATLDLLGPAGLSRADSALWVVTSYLLAYTVSLALVGRLSDTLPRKWVFIGCIVIFIAGAVWSGTANDLPLRLLEAFPIWSDREALPLIALIIGRVLQAIGAGASVSVGMALMGDIFPEGQRNKPISLISALDSIGWVIGNLWAGLMLQVLPSWRDLFLINAVIAFAALILTLFALRGVKSTRLAERFDWRGAVLFGAVLVMLTIGAEMLSKSSSALVLIGLSLVLLVIFAIYQWRARYSLFDMKFMRQPTVRVALVANLIAGFSLILLVAGVPLVINLRAVFLRGEGLLTGALRAGIVLCALTVPLMVAVLVGERRYHKVGAPQPIVLGFLLALVGFALTPLWSYTAPIFIIAVPLAMIGAGLGMTLGPLSLVVVDAAQDAARGLASALVLVLRLIGMTIGTPLAATLTLNLANEQANIATQSFLPGLKEIARPMLVPPLTIDALSQLLIAGGVACGIGLSFYLFAAWQKHAGKALGLLGGLPALSVVIAAVMVVALVNAQVEPAVLPNPIASRLPASTEFYAGLNIQRIFLANSRRPLNAVVNIVRGFTGQPPIIVPAYLPPTPQQTEVFQSAEEELLTNALRALLGVKWENSSYEAFCTSPQTPDQRPLCFVNSLLSWIGPQAAFALLSNSETAVEYAFFFQTTNRNNAILFASNMAKAIGIAEPRELRPNVHVLEINPETANARQIAINDAYMIIGTPNAVQSLINLHGTTLAASVDYQATVGRLPPEDFLTLYIQTPSLANDLRPSIRRVFNSDLVDAFLKLLDQFAPLQLGRINDDPLLIGVAVKVDDRNLGMHLAASLPYDLRPLNNEKVAASTLSGIPAQSEAWAAASLNIAGAAHALDFSTVLSGIARESQLLPLVEALSNPLVRVVVDSLLNKVKALLTYSNGQIALMRFSQGAEVEASFAVILPMTPPTQAESPQSLLAALGEQVNTFGAPLGIQAETELLADGSQVIHFLGKTLLENLPRGLSLSLTEYGLVIADSQDVAKVLEQISQAQTNSVLLALQQPLDKFLYGYIASPTAAEQAGLRFSGEIQDQILYVDVVLETTQ